MAHVFLFLHVSCNFVLGSAYLKKTSTFHNLYELASQELHQSGRLEIMWTSQTFPADGSSLDLWVNSQFEKFAGVFFQESVISSSLSCPSVVLQVLQSCCKPPSSLFYPQQAPRLLEYARYHPCSKFVKQNLVPQVAPWKSRMLYTCSNSFPPQGEAGS